MQKENVAWENRTAIVKMTNQQWSSLSMYLIMTTQYRNGERKSWSELAKQKDENGQVEFPNAASNTEFWDMMNELIDNVAIKAIDGRCDE